MIIDFRGLPICIGRSILNNFFLGQGKIKPCFYLQDGSESLIFNLLNILYLLNSPYNLINLTCLNNSRIFFNNENINRLSYHKLPSASISSIIK